MGERPRAAAPAGPRRRARRAPPDLANDWQAAALSGLAGRLAARALDVLEHVELAPAAVRADLAGPRVVPGYLASAAELLDRAADLAAASALLARDNDRRWRVFRARVRGVAGAERGGGAAR